MANNQFNLPRGWGLTGNAGTSATNNYVGTSDNNDLVIRRNNIEKFRIANAQINTADRLIVGTNSFTGGAFGIAANNFVFGSDFVTAGGNQYRTTTGTGFTTSYFVNGGSVARMDVVSNGRYEYQSSGGYIFYENGSDRLRILNGFTLNQDSNNYNLTYRGTTNSNLFHINAGTNNVGVGTNAPNASAILDINTASLGFGLPQLTNAAILAIVSPKNGLMVYNTTINHPCFFNGTAWQRISHSPM